jgi:hypothetical protein
LLIQCLYYQPCATQPSDQCGGRGGRPRRGWVSPQSKPVSSLHDVFRAAHSVATRKEGTVHFFTGLTGGGASTGLWPAHISKPSPLRSTAPAGPAASHRDHFLIIATLRIAATLEPQRPVARRE